MPQPRSGLVPPLRSFSAIVLSPTRWTVNELASSHAAARAVIVNNFLIVILR